MGTRQENSYELLKKYGSRWAVLTAMSMEMTKNGISLPQDVFATLDLTRIEITSGCYSTCEVDCTLNKVEGQLIAYAYLLGDTFLDQWVGLLADSMIGNLDYERILRIPALKPVESACGFLKCSC